jgi:hypothetical protein
MLGFTAVAASPIAAPFFDENTTYANAYADNYFEVATTIVPVVVDLTGVEGVLQINSVTAIAPVTLTVTGVRGIAALSSVSIVTPLQTAASGFLLGLGPIASASVASILPGSLTGNVVFVSGVSCRAVLGSVGTPTTVVLTGVSAINRIGTVVVTSSGVADLTGVTGIAVLNNAYVLIGDGSQLFSVIGKAIIGNVTVIAGPFGPGAILTGVSAKIQLGSVTVRTYNPTSWQNINTAQTPNWRLIST